MRFAGMIRIVFATALAMALCLAGRADAQYVPYGGYGGSGGWGGWPRASAAVVPRGEMAAQQGADRRQALAQNAAQQQSRNDFLLSQAQRSTASINQNRQSTQANWQNVMMQQDVANAARRESLAASGVPPVQLPGIGQPTTPQVPSTPQTPAATEPGTRWPTLLSDSRFAVPRAKLQEIFAAAEGGSLTTAQYDEIVKQAEAMMDVLRGMASEINAAEYLAVKQFLDDLVAKAKAAVRPTP